MREINELLLMKSTNHSYLYRLNKTKKLTLQKINKTSKSTKYKFKKYTKSFSHSIHCHYQQSPQQWQLCFHLQVGLLLEWEDPVAHLSLR